MRRSFLFGVCLSWACSAGGSEVDERGRAGDEVLPIQGTEPVLDPLPAGTQTTRLWVRRQRDELPFFLDLAAVQGDTAWYLSESTRASIRHIPRGSCRIGYILLRSFSDEELIQELATGARNEIARACLEELVAS